MTIRLGTGKPQTIFLKCTAHTHSKKKMGQVSLKCCSNTFFKIMKENQSKVNDMLYLFFLFEKVTGGQVMKSLSYKTMGYER
jgi:hypothetical protein